MPEMTNPHDAMVSFQSQFKLGRLKVRPAPTNPALLMYVDVWAGQPRFVYLTLDGETKTLTSFVNFYEIDAIDGVNCIAIGWAVPEKFRGEGRAKATVKAAIADLQVGTKQQMPTFWVEAIVGADNLASLRVAEQVISDKPEPMIDSISNKPAFRYLLKVG